MNKDNHKKAIGIRKIWPPKKEGIRDAVFWLMIYLYYLGTTWSSYANKVALIEKLLIKTSLQILLSYAILLILIPYVLRKNRKLLFLLSGLLSVYLTYVTYTAYRHFYFDPKYPDICTEQVA